jgi:hypothetical protein
VLTDRNVLYSWLVVWSIQLKYSIKDTMNCQLTMFLLSFMH